MATARVLHLPLHQPREDTAERAPLRLVRGARNGLGLSPRAGVIPWRSSAITHSIAV